MNSNMLSVSLQLPQFPITSIFVLGRVAGRLNVLIAQFKKRFIFSGSYSSHMQMACYSGPLCVHYSCCFLSKPSLIIGRRAIGIARFVGRYFAPEFIGKNL